MTHWGRFFPGQQVHSLSLLGRTTARNLQRSSLTWASTGTGYTQQTQIEGLHLQVWQVSVKKHPTENWKKEGVWAGRTAMIKVLAWWWEKGRRPMDHSQPCLETQHLPPVLNLTTSLPSSVVIIILLLPPQVIISFSFVYSTTDMLYVCMPVCIKKKSQGSCHRAIHYWTVNPSQYWARNFCHYWELHTATEHFWNLGLLLCSPAENEHLQFAELYSCFHILLSNGS